MPPCIRWQINICILPLDQAHVPRTHRRKNHQLRILRQKISAQEPTTKALSTITLLQLRTQELDRLSSQYKRLAHDNEVLKFKINQYKRGHEKIKSALDSHDPRAPGPRYLFDKRLNFFKK